MCGSNVLKQSEVENRSAKCKSLTETVISDTESESVDASTICGMWSDISIGCYASRNDAPLVRHESTHGDTPAVDPDLGERHY
jgi:hypothetical protein